METKRAALIHEVLTRTDQVNSLSPMELTSGQRDLRRFPKTQAERYVYDLLGLMLQQEWINPETEPLLDEILSSLGYLDGGGVTELKAWRHLFQLVDELRHQEGP